ncbi:MAG: ABC transporter ATP-binding protein [Lachnospiraceae bacterium]|nr:ABC transporter ATP-binding protein [Lachnospiraceae bacterium]
MGSEEIVLGGIQLNKTYRTKERIVRPLQNIDFCLHEGEILGIVGESGSGKSTLLRVIACLEKADSGKLLLHGREYTGSSPSFAGRYMQMIFQDAYASFDPRMKMIDSLREAGRRNTRGENSKNCDAAALRKPHRKEGTDDSRITEIVREVGLSEDLLWRRPRELSGGQCQRMSIARALCGGAEILLCDEITSALDVTTQAQVVQLLQRLRRKEKVSILFVSHDLALVGSLCDRIMVMKDGVCVEEGSSGKILGQPENEYTELLLKSLILI